MNYRGDCRTAPATPGLLKTLASNLKILITEMCQKKSHRESTLSPTSDKEALSVLAYYFCHKGRTGDIHPSYAPWGTLEFSSDIKAKGSLKKTIESLTAVKPILEPLDPPPIFDPLRFFWVGVCQITWKTCDTWSSERKLNMFWGFLEVHK